MTALKLSDHSVKKIAGKLLADEPELWATTMGTSAAALRVAAANEALLQSVLVGLMAPPTRHYRKKMLAYLDEPGEVAVHPFAGHVHMHYGIDVVPIAMLADLMTDAIHFVDGGSLEITQGSQFGGDDLRNVTIYFEDDLFWEHDGLDHSLVIGGGVPETVANTLTGQPLRRLFDHPSLQGLDVDIVDHKTVTGGATVFTAHLGTPTIAKSRKTASKGRWT